MNLFKAGDEVGSMWGDGDLRDSGRKGAYPLKLYVNGTHMINVSYKGYDIMMTSPVIWHKETGHGTSTGERPFEYPIYKNLIGTNLIVKFTGLTSGLTSGECAQQGNKENNVGDINPNWYKHTDDVWEDCEPPQEPKEMTVAEIEEALGHSVKVVK